MRIVNNRLKLKSCGFRYFFDVIQLQSMQELLDDVEEDLRTVFIVCRLWRRMGYTARLILWVLIASLRRNSMEIMFCYC